MGVCKREPYTYDASSFLIIFQLSVNPIVLQVMIFLTQSIILC